VSQIDEIHSNLEKAFLTLRTVSDKRGLSELEPVNPPEIIAWWLRMAEILYFGERNKTQAGRAVEIARNSAKIHGIKLTRKFKILSRFHIDSEPPS